MGRSVIMRRKAVEIAEDVLFPAAATVDRADRVPAAHLDLLAAEGFYGISAPPEDGGLGMADLTAAGHILAALASGCLATAFVWLQHLGPVLAAAHSDRPGLRERWLGPLAGGERRAGIALAGIRPGPAPLRVRETGAGFVLDGETPWVTGWDMIDTVHVAALSPDRVIHYLFVDAVAGPTLAVTPLELVAAQASRTVHIAFAGHAVLADRLTSTRPYEEWLRSDAAGAALNGFLAIGVAHRCCRLLGPGRLDAELAACRAALLAADGTELPAARAAASHLAWRAAAELAVRTGSRAVLGGDPAQRLLREAAFLLVFGSRPAIRDALLDRLT
jgi:alkylation response protein AidB-like acyl-CoA dehydrogenase